MIQVTQSLDYRRYENNIFSNYVISGRSCTLKISHIDLRAWLDTGRCTQTSMGWCRLLTFITDKKIKYIKLNFAVVCITGCSELIIYYFLVICEGSSTLMHFRVYHQKMNLTFIQQTQKMWLIFYITQRSKYLYKRY